jgi:hypothetical protein
MTTYHGNWAATIRVVCVWGTNKTEREAHFEFGRLFETKADPKASFSHVFSQDAKMSLRSDGFYVVAPSGLAWQAHVIDEPGLEFCMYPTDSGSILFKAAPTGWVERALLSMAGSVA